jgi:glycosyltransferase involved in cell wall biosynthesis
MLDRGAEMKRPVVAYFLGTNNDWGGASRALLNFVRKLDRQAFTPLVVIPRAGPLQSILAAQGTRCEVWPIHERSPNLPAYALNVVKSMAFFRRHQIALAHLNYGAIGWKPAEILAARMLRIPLVNHFHTAVKSASSYLRYSAALIGVSRYVCSHSDHRGVACHVVHNVADFDRFGGGRPKRAGLGLRADSVVVGFFGQVRRIKGISLFLELAGRIRDANVEFLIAGELKGEDTFSAEEFERMLGGDARIKYLGYREDIQDLYASCDIVVMPSQWEEPCAMVLFEASAAGKPIVATATGGTPEILDDGDTGYLVQRADLDALVERVLGLVRDPQLRQSIGARAKENVAKRFMAEPVRRLERLYTQLLASQKPAP